MTCEPDLSYLDHLATPVFVLEVGPDGRPVYVAFNSFARKVAERPLSDYLGRTADQVYDGELGAQAFQRHCEVARTGKAMTYEIVLPFKNGPRPIRTTLSPQLDGSGKVSLIFGSSVDLSAEQRARDTQVSLDTLASEMEQFIAMAAHDLRAPMRNIASLAEMLREDFEDLGDGKLELIDMLEEVAAKSMALIADVLSHARATEAQQKIELFNLGALCHDVFGVLDPVGRHILIAEEGEVRAEKSAMQIVLRNLIENALKHGGRPQMEIRVTARPVNGDQIEVSVTDNGAGFDNPGTQFLETGTFRVDSGYGMLGVRRLITARNGSIRAGNRSDPPGGIVTFTLPGHWHGDPLAVRPEPPLSAPRRIA